MNFSGQLFQKVPVKNKTRKWKKYFFEFKNNELIKHRADGTTSTISFSNSVIPVYEMDDRVIVLFVNDVPLILQALDDKDYVSWIQCFNQEQNVPEFQLTHVDEIAKKQEFIIQQEMENEQLFIVLEKTFNDYKVQDQCCKVVETNYIDFIKKQDSLVKILSDPETFPLFLNFCRTIKCEEIVLFWNEAEVFKKHSDYENPERIAKEAKRIFEKYLTEESKHHININGTIRDQVRSQLMNPKRNMFLDVQNEMVFLMKQNAWKLFMDSDFKVLIK